MRLTIRHEKQLEIVAIPLFPLTYFDILTPVQPTLYTRYNDMAEDTVPTISIIPAPGYIIVKPIEIKEVSGFSISGSAQEQDQAGLVLDVGGVLTTDYGAKINTNVDVGQTVVHKPYYTHPFKYSEFDLKFIRFQDIVGIYE